MYTIRCMNKIAPVGLNRLDTKQFLLDDTTDCPEGLLVRSAALHDSPLIETVLGIARAGAGTNNIPVEECAKKGVVVFNTPGANANAVRELAICALFLASRDVLGGMSWARGLTGDDIAKQVEKGKSQFVGPEIYGKTLGLIGLGAIGVGVANAAHHLGMDVMGYDPFISVDAAWGLSRSVKHCHDLKAMLAQCDYISLHLPLNGDTKGMINAQSLADAKDGVRIINFARGELVSDADLIAALDSGKVARYVTDFPNANLVHHEKVVPIPHLGASTPESEDNCAVMAADQLSDFLLYGNIKNSVNYPDVELPWIPGPRLCIMHRNVPKVLSNISSLFGDKGINIENFLNKSKGEYACTLLDTVDVISEDIVEHLRATSGVIRVRLISGTND